VNCGTDIRIQVTHLRRSSHTKLLLSLVLLQFQKGGDAEPSQAVTILWLLAVRPQRIFQLQEEEATSCCPSSSSRSCCPTAAGWKGASHCVQRLVDATHTNMSTALVDFFVRILCNNEVFLQPLLSSTLAHLCGASVFFL
jgi:hypothetical protein